jgi:hypothetical protein
MQNAIKLENISNLITSPPSYQCRKTTVNMKVSDTVNMKVSGTVNMKVSDTVNMKVSEFCYYMHFHYY